MSFCHLHVHSNYSLLDGFSTPEALVKQAKKLGQEAIALTEHGNVYSAMKLLTICKEQGIKPILGEEFYFDANGDIPSKSPSHLVLLATNAVGINNLYRLSTLSSLEGFYRVPRLKPSMIKGNSKGLICLTACEKGLFAQAIAAEDAKRAQAILELLDGLFPKVYIEVMPIEGREKLVNELVGYAVDINRPYVITNDVHYVNEKDYVPHGLMVKVNTQGRLTDFVKGLWLKSEDEMKQLFNSFGDLTRGMEMAAKIAAEVNYG
jgi:DNA polymerase III subunit alpha